MFFDCILANEISSYCALLIGLGIFWEFIECRKWFSHLSGLGGQLF